MPSNKEARVEALKHPGRAEEIIEALAREFRLAPHLVAVAVGAAVAAAARRLGPVAGPALVSWFPCAWAFIRPDHYGLTRRPISAPRGRDLGAREEMVMAAAAHGVPCALAPRFAALLTVLIGERCGSALARALQPGRGREDVPETAAGDDGISAGAAAAGPSAAAPRPRAARPSSPPPDGASGPSGRRCR